MKKLITIIDGRGYRWAYDLNNRRFYLDDPGIEKELGDENGYYCEPEELLGLLIGDESVADFNMNEAYIFIHKCQRAK